MKNSNSSNFSEEKTLLKDESEDKTLLEDESEDETILEDESEDETILEDESEDETLFEKDDKIIPSEKAGHKGKVIEGLYLVKNITKGGMGIIYFVEHLKWGIKLVVKSPLKEFLSGENKNRFIREAETWVDLGKHPGIATAFYVREIDGIPGIFIEYADGGSLTSWMKQKNRDLPEILDIAIQFCDGISYAHSRGLVHRDIKPDNVLLMKDGTVKITDFGLVKSKKKLKIPLEEGGRPDEIAPEEWKTMTGRGAMGTPPYMPPEQWTEAEKVDKRADIYSFGVMLYEMVCRRRPFIQDPANAHPPLIAYQIMHRFNPPPAPENFCKNLPEDFKKLMLQCLEKKAEDRPENFEEILDRLLILYREITGKDYEREEPKEGELKAEDLNNRALSYMDLGRKKDAVKCLKEAIKLDPLSIPANINFILISLEEEKIDYENLLKRFKSVREGNNKNPYPYYYEAIFELEYGNPKRSLSLISKALELDNSVSPFWNIKGVILSSLKNYNDALSAFSMAIKIEKNPDYIKNYAASLYMAGKYTRSYNEFSKLLNDYPKDNELKIDFAICLTSKERHEKSIEIFEKTLKTCPDSIRVNLLYGEFLSGIKTTVPTFNYGPEENLQKSTPYLKKALDLAPHFMRSVCSYRENLKSLSLPVPELTPPVPSKEVKIKEEERKVITPAAGNIKKIEGKEGRINGVKFLDEKTAVSCSSDSVVAVWDLEKGQCIKKLYEEKSYLKFEAFDLSISPCKKYILSAHGDDTVKMWDIDEEKLVKVFYGHENIVRTVSFSPDGGGFASGSGDGSVNMWDIFTGNIINTTEKEGGAIFSVKFSPCKKYIASAGEAGLIQLWNREDGSLYKKLEGHRSPIMSLNFSPDGKYILSAGKDKTLRLWHIAKEKCIKTFQGHSFSINCAAFSPSSCYIASGDRKGWIKLWDIEKEEAIRTIKEHREEITDLAFSPSGKTILSSSKDRSMSFIDIPAKGDGIFQDNYKKEYLIVRPRSVKETSKDIDLFEKLVSQGEKLIEEKEWKKAHDIFRKALNIPGYSKDMRCLEGIKKSGKGGIRKGIKNIWKEKIFSRKEISAGMGGICLKDSIVSYGEDNTIKIIDIEKDKNLANMKGHRGKIIATAISDDEKRLFSISDDKSFKIWDINSGTCIKTIAEEMDLNSLALFPGSRYIATGGGMTDSSVRLWNSINGEILRTLQGHSSSVESIALSGDGKKILTAGSDKLLKLWDVESGKCLRNFSGHILPLNCCDISPDGTMALSGGRDNTVRLWDTEREKCIDSLKIDGEVTCVAFSSDGLFIIAGSSDNKIRIWKEGQNTPLRILEEHKSAVRSIKFSHDGQYIISGDSNGNLIKWKIDWDWGFNKIPLSPPAEKTVLMEPELVIEARDEFIPDDTEYLIDQEEKKKFKLGTTIVILVSIICGIMLISFWWNSMKKAKARRISQKLCDQFYDPMPYGPSYGREDSGWTTWDECIQDLLEIGKPAVKVLVKEGLNDRNPDVRLNSLIVLEKFPNKKYVAKESKEELIKLLEDEVPVIRGKAAILIAGLEIKEALPQLEEALKKENGRWDEESKELIEKTKIKKEDTFNHPGIMGQGFITYSRTYYSCNSCHGFNSLVEEKIGYEGYYICNEGNFSFIFAEENIEKMKDKISYDKLNTVQTLTDRKFNNTELLVEKFRKSDFTKEEIEIVLNSSSSPNEKPWELVKNQTETAIGKLTAGSR